MLQYILAQNNPYQLDFSTPAKVLLHNILNGQDVHPEISQQILRCLEHGKKCVDTFRKEWYVRKEKKLSAVIHRCGLPFLGMILKTTQASGLQFARKNLKVVACP